MRTVSGPKPGELRRYVPKAFGNHEDPQPVAVWIRNPTERKKRELLAVGKKGRIALTPEGQPMVDAEGRPSVIEIDLMSGIERECSIIGACVEKVENYTAAGGDPINDGTDLATHGEPLIVVEVADEITSAMSLTEEERKNSGVPQPSRQELPAQISTAGNASLPGLVCLGTATVTGADS